MYLGHFSVAVQEYVSVALKTAQGLLTMFRQTIYHHSIGQLRQMFLAGEIDIDESMYGGHPKRK